MPDYLSHFEFLMIAGALVGVWIKHQNDYASLKSRVKTLELRNDKIDTVLNQLAEDMAEIKLLLARNQMDR
jgi:hypothetical protein